MVKEKTRKGRERGEKKEMRENGWLSKLLVGFMLQSMFSIHSSCFPPFSKSHLFLHSFQWNESQKKRKAERMGERKRLWSNSKTCNRMCTRKTRPFNMKSEREKAERPMLGNSRQGEEEAHRERTRQMKRQEEGYQGKNEAKGLREQHHQKQRIEPLTRLSNSWYFFPSRREP